MADKSEHYEVWFTEAEGHKRHQKADSEAQAVEIAEGHHTSGFDNVTVHKITTSVTDAVVTVELA